MGAVFKDEPSEKYVSKPKEAYTTKKATEYDLRAVMDKLKSQYAEAYSYQRDQSAYAELLMG